MMRLPEDFSLKITDTSGIITHSVFFLILQVSSECRLSFDGSAIDYKRKFPSVLIHLQTTNALNKLL